MIDFDDSIKTPFYIREERAISLTKKQSIVPKTAMIPLLRCESMETFLEIVKESSFQLNPSHFVLDLFVLIGKEKVKQTTDNEAMAAAPPPQTAAPPPPQTSSDVSLHPRSFLVHLYPLVYKLSEEASSIELEKARQSIQPIKNSR